MKLRKLVASIGAAVVGSAAIVAAGVSAASAATAPTGMTIIAAGHTTTVAQSTASSPETAQPVKVCLENAETQCADVKDSSNTANTRVWLYHNGNDDKWLKVLDTECIGAGLEDCYFLEDAENTSLCLSATGSFGADIELRNCSDTGAWFAHGDELGNGDYGANGNLVANGDASKDYLYANRTGNWSKWDW